MAYGWTYAEIDAHTLGEVMDLIHDWPENPPLYILVKALVEGLTGVKPRPRDLVSAAERAGIEPASLAKLQAEAMIAARERIEAGPAAPPPNVGAKDLGLPKKAPVFDLDEMRRRNQALYHHKVMDKVTKKES